MTDTGRSGQGHTFCAAGSFCTAAVSSCADSLLLTMDAIIMASIFASVSTELQDRGAVL